MTIFCFFSISIIVMMGMYKTHIVQVVIQVMKMNLDFTHAILGDRRSSSHAGKRALFSTSNIM